MSPTDKMTPHDYANAKALVVELQKELTDTQRQLMDILDVRNARIQELEKALDSAQGTICGEFCVGSDHHAACLAISQSLQACAFCGRREAVRAGEEVKTFSCKVCGRPIPAGKQ